MRVLIRMVLLIAGAVSFIVPGAQAGQTFKVDPRESKVEYKVRHLGVSVVRGEFKSFQGSIVLENDALTQFTGSVETGSLTTGNDIRDTELKGNKFFAVTEFPLMTIQSEEVTSDKDGIIVKSLLTIKDVTRPVEWRGRFVRVSGTKEKIQLVLQGKINRKDFHLKFRRFLELLVNDSVYVTLELTGS